jgi:hypothetical protein
MSEDGSELVLQSTTSDGLSGIARLSTISTAWDAVASRRCHAVPDGGTGLCHRRHHHNGDHERAVVDDRTHTTVYITW